jgi:hypothetical protein
MPESIQYTARRSEARVGCPVPCSLYVVRCPYPLSPVVYPVVAMPWYDYVASFFAGMFLSNAVPHFMHGVSGDPFPTPFAKPPGKGLSSPTVNVLWALLNLAIGYVLIRLGQVSDHNIPALVVFFLGVAAISIMSSIGFRDKHPR